MTSAIDVVERLHALGESEGYTVESPDGSIGWVEEVWLGERRTPRALAMRTVDGTRALLLAEQVAAVDHEHGLGRSRRRPALARARPTPPEGGPERAPERILNDDRQDARAACDRRAAAARNSPAARPDSAPAGGRDGVAALESRRRPLRHDRAPAHPDDHARLHDRLGRHRFRLLSRRHTIPRDTRHARRPSGRPDRRCPCPLESLPPGRERARRRLNLDPPRGGWALSGGGARMSKRSAPRGLRRGRGQGRLGCWR
jgi:hypothetical protein